MMFTKKFQQPMAQPMAQQRPPAPMPTRANDLQGQVGGPQPSGLGGSLSQSAVSRPMASVAMNQAARPSRYASRMAPSFRGIPTGRDDMTGVSDRRYAGQPNAVEAARAQQGAGLGGSLPQPKQYSNAPNVVNYTNRTYAAPQQQSPVPMPPMQPSGVPPVAPPKQPMSGSPVPTVPPRPQPQAPPLMAPPGAQQAQPQQQPAPSGGPLNERALRDKEAMQ